MKRIVNVRIPVIFGCFLAGGIALGCLFNFKNTSLLWLVAGSPVAAIVILLSVLLKKKKLFVFALIFFAAFYGGFFGCFQNISNYRHCDVNTELNYVITGTVADKGVTAYGEYIIIENARADDIALGGKVRVYLPEIYGDFCDTGYSVSFRGTLNLNDAFPYGELNYYAEDNVKYTCSLNGEITSVYRYSFFGSIRNRIKATLYDNLDYDTAAICCGMLLGNTQSVDDEALDSFRYGGIAHIFAVSGLHIGLIYGIFTFIFKKLRLNQYLSAALRLFAIIFYAGVCGFTLSSVRAVIMCAAVMLAGLLHLKSDRLNNLAFAASVILLINPLSLFSVGFQLSVCAVGGIILFSNSFKRVFRKIVTPNKILSAGSVASKGKGAGVAASFGAKISSGIGATLGAQIGTLPVSMAKFGYVSAAGLLLNLLVIPVVSVLFTVLFSGTFISVVLPPAASFIIPYAALPLEALLSFILNTDFEKALITGFGAGAFAPLYLVVMLALSDKINLAAIPRAVLCTFAVSMLAACVLFNSYTPSSGYKITVSGYGNGGNVIMKSTQGTVLVMTENASVTRIKNSLRRDYSENLDAIVIIGGPDCASAYDPDLNCNDVYVCSLYIPVQPYREVETHYEKDFSVCGIQFGFIDGHSITANVGGVRIIISDSENLPAENCDLLISLYENYDLVANSPPCNAAYTVYFNLRGSKYNAYDGGDLKFFINDGKISGLD